jgi:hypothetical protein
MAVLRVLYHAHDLVHFLRTRRSRLTPESHADGIRTQSQLLCERLVHDGHTRRLSRVAIVEVTSRYYGDAQRLEIIRANCAEIRVLSLRRVVAVNPDGVAPAHPAQRDDVRVSRRIHSGNSTDPVEQLPLKRAPPFYGNLQARVIESGDQHAVCAESRIVSQQISQATREQQRTEQQHQRQRHLRHHQRSAESQPPARCRHAAAAGLHRRARSGARSPQRGSQPEQHTRHQRCPEQKCEQPPVQLEVERHRIVLRAQVR